MKEAESLSLLALSSVELEKATVLVFPPQPVTGASELLPADGPVELDHLFAVDHRLLGDTTFLGRPQEVVEEFAVLTVNNSKIWVKVHRK